MVVGPGEADRWLDQVFRQRKELTDDMVVCLNGEGRQIGKERRLCKKYGFWCYEDTREWGIHQPDIKTDLLKKAGRLKPDWILPSDADEIYDKYFTREEADKLARTGDIGFYFYLVNLWNDETRCRKALNFWNIRFFRYAPEFGLVYARKRVHCGLAPPVVYYHGSHAPFIVKHYGLMKPEDRKKKVERYEKYDPRAVFKDRSYYDALKLETIGSPFDEDEMHKKVVDEVASYHEKPKLIEPKIYV